jgi:F0F1-type ATP synthase membrane subunit c/vacuolar-type H+-ATPase subunit K
LVPLRNNLHAGLPKGFHAYFAGLAISITGNVPAYGYSIVVTSAFGVVAAEHQAPSVFRIFLFLLGATAGFSVLGALGALAFEEEEIGAEGPVTLLVGGAMSIFSTSGGFGLALLIAYLLGGWVVWLVAPLCATVAYVLLLAAEMGLADALRR